MHIYLMTNDLKGYVNMGEAGPQVVYPLDHFWYSTSIIKYI